MCFNAHHQIRSLEEEHYLQYFRHQHQLQLITEIKNGVACFVCHEPCLQGQPIYGCIPCDCFAHKSCAQLPIQIQHPFHPSHHSLTLTTNHFEFRCDHCNTQFSTFRFYCEETEFRLCLKCFPLKPYRSGAEELLPEIKHPFSPESPLLLQGNKDFWCDSCHKFFSTDWCYWSQECQMDIHCALMPPIIETEDQGNDHVIRHCGHQHPLIFMEMKNDEDFQQVHCFVCRHGFLQGQSTYGCKRCECYAHKSCAELPSEMQHVFHTRHPLVLRSGQYQKFRCNFCVSLSSSFRYLCKECDFSLCLKCLYVKPTIHYKSHPHALFFMERIFKETLNCNECDKSIKAFVHEDDDYFPTQNCAYRCKECDFNLHLLCGPLPRHIEHGDYGHPLTYMDSVVEDDTCIYHCKLCQEKRDSRGQVYWCADCKYIADVNCVISEVLHILKGEPDSVGLRAVGEPIEAAEVNMRALYSTLAYIMNNLSKDDEQELNVLLAPLQAKSYDKVTPNAVQQEHDYRKEYLPSADKDYHQLMRRLCSAACLINNSKDMVIRNCEFEQKLVVVDGYMISWKLIHVLKELLGKNKNFTPDNSNFTPKVKAVCIFFLCWVVNSMRKERAVYVTETMLAYWWHYLNALLHKGFKIDFLIEHLNRVTQAYFGLQAKKQNQEIRASLYKRSTGSLPEKNKLKEQLGKHQELYKQYEMYIASRKPRLIQKCLEEASKLGWSYTYCECIADCEYIDETNSVMISKILWEILCYSFTKLRGSHPGSPTNEVDHINTKEQSEAVSNEETISDEDQQKLNVHYGFSPYTIKDFHKLIERLKLYAPLEPGIEESELKKKAVDNIVGGYLNTRDFAPILKHLMTKYGDLISEGSQQSPEANAFLYYVLCWTINSMRKTWVTHVTEDLLAKWLFLLSYVKGNGFNIEFIFNRLTRVIQAHFGFENARRDYDILQTLNRNRMSISKELNNLEYEVEEYKRLYEQHKTYMALPKSSLMEKCLEEAQKLEWTSALPNL
ncbi:Cysteine/Histidine-rich C1 domain family protein [Quillaja saponaria]|uniref:Cysteine/Histidine-rich C1 domain family protein n=1 Tax=Quillaja saponaria TaxID=32244 RepID=A0AAD7M3C6_QUISA|nr:Cysteine/Histidine-rich C1 domain family protein [Quillaja saponaria]